MRDVDERQRIPVEITPGVAGELYAYALDNLLYVIFVDPKNVAEDVGSWSRRVANKLYILRDLGALGTPSVMRVLNGGTVGRDSLKLMEDSRGEKYYRVSHGLFKDYSAEPVLDVKGEIVGGRIEGLRTTHPQLAPVIDKVISESDPRVEAIQVERTEGFLERNPHYENRVKEALRRRHPEWFK